MRQSAFIIIFLFHTFLCNSIRAQSPQPFFRHFTLDDGLPSSQVYQAIQDADGYMWFATDRGVVKYNGYEFKTFTDKDGLNDNVVFTLFQDYKKRIWMISFSGRIFIYENNKITSYRYNDKIKELIKGSFQMEIIVDSLENVYAASTSGSYYINNNGVVSCRFKPFGSGVISKLVIDERANINMPVAMGSASETPRITDLFHFTKEMKDSIRMPSLQTGRIRAVRLKNNKIILAIGPRLFELKNKYVIPLTTLPADVIYFYEDPDEQLWVCTIKGLFLITNKKNYNEYACYLQGKYVSGICRDREGGYWITSIDDGIYYLANNKVRSYVTNQRLKASLTLASDRSEIYAGYFGGSLAKMNTKEFHLIIDDTSGEFIDPIFYDTTSSRLYLGNNLFCYLYGNKFYPLKTIDARRLKIGYAKTKMGIFSGSYGTIAKIIGDSTSREANFKTRINCIYANDREEILLGCIDGVYKYDPINKTIALLYPELKEIRVDDIKEINGNLCFATQGHGVMILLKNNRFIKIDESKGLCNNTIRKILVEKKRIWCTSYNGISEIIFSDINNAAFSVINIRTNEGLISNEINDIALLNDTVWLASKKGISFFSSNTDFINHAPPLVHFISLRVNSTDTVLKDNYRFPHSLNNISIGFESPLFKSNALQLYEYKLMVEGDSITGTSSNRSVQFLSLEPGSYSLFVKALNNSGTITTEAAMLRFTILAPWYATWWFRLLCLALLVAVGFVFYKRRVKKLKEKFSIEKKQASLQLTAMRAQMNPHFIFNVMSSIRNYMQNNDMASAEKYLVSFAKLVRYTLDNSSVQEVSLEEELEAIQSFATLEMQRVEKGFDFEIHCDEAIDQEEVMLPSLLLQPFLENAIKHGIERLNTRGKINIEIKKLDEHILIAIEDNGVGRVESMEWNMANRGRHISVGATLTFDRIEAFNKAYNRNIKARIIDLNEVDKNKTGTRVEIEL